MNIPLDPKATTLEVFFKTLLFAMINADTSVAEITVSIDDRAVNMAIELKSIGKAANEAAG